jgi:hypothetical protein
VNEFEKIKRENEIMRRYLNAIYTLGFDRDGFTRAEDLGDLIDELAHYAQLGLECNTEEPMSTNEGIKYNILNEVLYYSKEKIKELSNTVELMDSEDYKDRFKAEYYQTKIRYDKLHKMVIKYEAGTLDFTPSCSLELLKNQLSYMGNYLRILEIRAEVEGIKL